MAMIKEFNRKAPGAGRQVVGTSYIPYLEKPVDASSS